MRPAARTVAAGVAGALLAALFDIEALYVPSIAAALLGLVCAAWVAIGARGVRVTRTVAVATAVEDEPIEVEVLITARAPGPPGGVLEDSLLPGGAPFRGGPRRTRIRIQARFARRGRKTLPPPVVVVRDPFGLARRRVRGTETHELLVLPRTEPVRVAESGGDSAGLGTNRGRMWVAAEIDLDGIRSYRPGTPASRIHWPALARSDELLERKLRADSDTRPLVVLDPRGAEAEDHVDAAVRAAASLCLHLARHGGCAMLIPGARRPVIVEPGLAAWPRLHVQLALVGELRAPALAHVHARRGPVYYVAARPLTSMPPALAHAPGGGRILVVPTPFSSRAAAFTVAGCTGYEMTGVRNRARARTVETA